MGNDPMCRTCRTVRGLMNIFDEENKELITMLGRVAYIFIKEDDLLPKQICYSCSNSLQMAYEFVEQCQKTDKILRAKLDEFTFLKETPPKSPNISDDDRVSVKIEPIEGIIVKSVLNQDSASVITIEDYPKDDGVNGRYIDDKGIEFNVDDIIEVDEDYVEEISVMDFDNYIEECTEEVTTQDATVTLQPEIVQPITKSSTKSKRMSKMKIKKPPRIKQQKKHHCPFCSDTFINFAEFNAHKKSHGRYRHSCKVCDKKFTTKDKIRTHMEIHNGSKVPCHLCDKQCSNRGNLARHIKQCHDRLRPYSCEVCKARFFRRSSLKLHAATHSDERSYACNVCGKTFKTPTALNIHKRSHQPDFNKSYRNKKYGKGIYICEYCGKEFNSQGNHSQHVKIHSDVRNFECEVCHKRFLFKISLTTHMLSHTGERPYTCDICGKGFRQTAHLRNHKRVIHEPEAAKRFACKFCNKRFTSTGNLKVHERLHTGEKPYKCDACSLRFIDTNCLKRHRRKVHSIDTPNTRKVVVLDERNSVTTHENDIGQLSLGQEHIVGDQDFVLDSWNELVGTEL